MTCQSHTVQPSTETDEPVRKGIHRLFGRWYANFPKGYPRISKRSGYGGQYVHRAVWAKLAADGPLNGPNGGKLPDDCHVHHQDFNKMNFCPYNLIAMPPCFNPRSEIRCPYTGLYMTKSEFVRRLL